MVGLLPGVRPHTSLLSFCILLASLYTAAASSIINLNCPTVEGEEGCSEDNHCCSLPQAVAAMRTETAGGALGNFELRMQTGVTYPVSGEYSPFYTSVSRSLSSLSPL